MLVWNFTAALIGFNYHNCTDQVWRLMEVYVRVHRNLTIDTGVYIYVQTSLTIDTRIYVTTIQIHTWNSRRFINKFHQVPSSLITVAHLRWLFTSTFHLTISNDQNIYEFVVPRRKRTAREFRRLENLDWSWLDDRRVFFCPLACQNQISYKKSATFDVWETTSRSHVTLAAVRVTPIIDLTADHERNTYNCFIPERGERGDGGGGGR